MIKNIVILLVCLIYTCSSYSAENKPFVIFLNGTSSAGKSSIAHELQEQIKEPTLHTGLDHFLAMLPQKHLVFGKEADQGFKFVPTTDGKHPITNVEVGPVGFQLYSAMHRSMKALIDANFNLIIDDVLFFNEVLQDYIRVFQGYKVYFISVKPPVEVAAQRELDRGDRVIGLARGSYDAVYSNKIIDMEIDSSKTTPEQSAKLILDYVKEHPHPTAFNSNKI
jgi:chloramphenicol 3-O phosphotransferase